MSKKPSRIKISRVQVNLTPQEFTEVKTAAVKQQETVPTFFRRVLLESIDKNFTAPKQKTQFEKLESQMDFLSSRISKLESVLRILVVNTAIIRGHATGVVDLSPQASQEVLKNRMIESRDHQKKLFFDLYPEMREEAQ